MQLLSVNGVGPKVALAIVSGSPAAELRRAIVLEDTARFAGHPRDRQEDRRADRARAEGEARPRDRDRPDRPPWLGATSSRGTRSSSSGTRSWRPSGRSPRSIPTCPPRSGSGSRSGGRRERAAFLAPVLAGRRTTSSTARSGRSRLAEFVGQERVQGAARDRARRREGARGEALDHVLLVGPPGLGKTSLALIVREELGVGLRSVAGPALERKGDLAAILTQPRAPRRALRRRDPPASTAAVEEILYAALEDFRLDIVVGQGPAARTLTLDLPQFTLVGATTRTGPADDAAPRPLRDDVPARALRAGGAGRDRAPLGADPRRRDRGRGRRRDRPPLARDARGSRTGSSAASATSPRCGTRARSRPRSRARRSSCSRSTSAGSSGPTASCSRAIVAQVRRRPGRPLDARGRARRGAGHDRGRLRAVPAPARLPPAHAARADRHRARAARTSARRADDAPVPEASGRRPRGCARGPETSSSAALTAVIAALRARRRASTRALVQSSCVDGARFALDSLSAEPGFGFVTLVPHRRGRRRRPGALDRPGRARSGGSSWLGQRRSGGASASAVLGE